MEIKDFIDSLRKSNFSLSVENGKLNLKGDRSKLTKNEIDAIRSNDDVINYIKQNKIELIKYISDSSEEIAVKRLKDISAIYRLSGLQQGMLFHGLYDNNSAAHKVQFVCDLLGVNTAVFQKAWTIILKQHSILRSSFYYDRFSVPVQCVFNEVALPLEIIDSSNLADDEKRLAAETFETTDRFKAFDFKTAPLIRLALLRLTDDRYRMVWTFHHILFDGWSLSILMEEFLTIYETLVNGQEPILQEEDKYEDYIRYIERIDKNNEETYWTQYLENLEEGSLLPFIANSNERNKGKGIFKASGFELTNDLSERIQQYAQRNRFTVNTLMQAAWSYLLSRYTGKKDIVFGTVASGRPEDLPGVEKRIGMYINTLPFYTKVKEDTSIKDWLLQIQTEQVSSRQFQHSGLNDTQRWSTVTGDLFDTLLVFENYPVNKVLGSQHWKLRVENVKIHNPTNYPFTILVNNSEKIHIECYHNVTLLAETYVSEIMGHFVNVLEQVADDVASTIGELELITKSEEQELLFDFNETSVNNAPELTLTGLFEEQAEKTPHVIAVAFAGESLTYRELNEKANQLAGYLLQKGIREDQPVPLCLERSVEMIVSVLAILKAGAVYVPIDPAYPAERIQYMLADTSARLMISNSNSISRLLHLENVEVISLDTDWQQIENFPINNIKMQFNPQRLAFILYTSGSTGIPKGVQMPAINLVNLLLWQEKQFSNHKRKVIQFASLNFDVSFQEIFSTLCFGSSLYLIAEERRKDVTELLADIKSYGITHLFIPYIVLKSIAEFSHFTVSPLGLEEVIVAGEQLKITSDIAQFLRENNIRIVNQYGPTETHVATSYIVNIDDNLNPLPPIGKPIDNVKIYIRDTAGRICPAGVGGEIYIAGAQVARGYWNRPELTAEKFLPDPYSRIKGARMYRSGDLGRWLPDGNLEYLGRIDDQVKVRGFRVELGEIESVLQQSDLVRQGVVLAKEDHIGIRRLVAYVVPETTFNKDLIAAFVKSKLPEFMVPSLWIELDKFPLSPNGKIDRKALPDPDINSSSAASFVAPRNATEIQLALIWQELLGAERIGVHDNFFELGGHSLLAMRVVSAVRRTLSADLAIRNFFENPTISALSASLLNNIKQLDVPAISIQERPEFIPLSFTQERLWFIDRFEGTLQYHIPAVLNVKGQLDIAALQFAFQTILRRHEVLRTVILEEEGLGYQKVLPPGDFVLTVIDGHHLQETGAESASLVRQLINQSFDLSRDLQLRVALINLAPGEHILVITMHHIASDGWSLAVVVKELIELYESFVQDRPIRLAVPSIQYADFAVWQRSQLQGALLDKKMAYWKSKLHKVSPLLLPTDAERPAVQSLEGGTETFYLDRAFTGSLQQFSQQQGVTLFMTLLGAFKVLLQRYSSQQDICVGTPVANRLQPELENLIGFFVNTIALRSDVQPNMPFAQFLQQLRGTTMEAFEYQDVPFEKVVDALAGERSVATTPVFQVMFVLHNTPELPRVELPGLLISNGSFDNPLAKFDLSLNIFHSGDGLKGSLQYASRLFGKPRIARLIGHFRQLLAAVISKPDTLIGLLPILQLSERNLLIKEFNNTSYPYPEAETLLSLFSKQARLTPQAIALVQGKLSISYATLNERSGQLAALLIEQGISNGAIVPVCMNRCPDLVVAMLGVMKAGAAYVPVDPGYPAERIQLMLKDAGASLVITNRENLSILEAQSPGVQFLAIDSLETRALQPQELPAVLPGQLAYVLFTSGSLGRPKAVKVTHKSLSMHLQWFNRQYKISAADSSLLVSSFSFDGSMTATWPVLLCGGALHMPAQEAFDPAALLDYIATEKITYVKTLPAIVRALTEAPNFTHKNILSSVRLLIVGGEKMNIENIRYYLSYYPAAVFSNHYGPTEATISSSYFIVDRHNIDSLSTRSVIGKPVDNYRIFILNEQQQVQPLGVPGQIFISGAGVAAGYLNEPTLTAERFVIDPFSGTESEMMYRTGDLGNWLEDGTLEFHGRMDEQVKIRGYRVEPGEVESILQQSGFVEAAAVIALPDPSGDLRLLAYIVSPAYDKDALFQLLKHQVPEYMIPAIWVQLDALPLSANGKVDRNALPAPSSTDVTADSAFTAPANSIEQTLSDIWIPLLGVDKIGMHDNFFAAGGHSLMAMRVIAAIRKKLDVEVAIKDLFFFPTIAALARNIVEKNNTSILPAIRNYDRTGLIPLSFNQERLWFIDQLEGSIPYHLPTVLRLSGEINIAALEYAINAVIGRHEILRTVITQQDGVGYQSVLDKTTFQLQQEDGSHYANNAEMLQTRIQDLIRVPFNLSAGLVLRASLVRLSVKEHLLVFVLHHIASDGWSTSVLVKDVVAYYDAFITGQPVEIAPLPVQYGDFAIWQRDYLCGDVLQNKIKFWKEKLADPQPLQLPTDFTRPAVQSNKGSFVSFDISNQLLHSAKELSNRRGTTLFMTLLAAFKVLLSRYSGQQDICVGTGISGRDQQELESLIGFFVNTIALRTNVDDQSSFLDLLDEVKNTTLEAYENQNVPFAKVVDAVMIARDLSRSPLFQVIFVLQNTPEIPELRLADLQLSAVEVEHTTSKLDLTFILSENENGLHGEVEFCTDLFKEETVRRMMEHYRNLLHSALATPATKLSDLVMLGETERRQLLEDFNPAQKEAAQTDSFVRLFEEQVQLHPTAAALVFKDEMLTYSDLNQLCNMLARRLAEGGLKPGDLVPVCVGQSPAMFVALLAVLKAGAAYVPIDPEHPQERLDFILQDTAAAFIVTDKLNATRFESLPQLTVLEIPLKGDLVKGSILENLNLQVQAEQPAYLIYTSGSTGLPKAVVIPQGAMMHYLLNPATAYINKDSNRSGSFAHLSFTFDASVTALFLPLLHGKLVVIGSEKQISVFEDPNFEKYAPYDFIKLTPSHLELLHNHLYAGNGHLITGKLVLGGEALKPAHLDFFAQQQLDITIINEYGPTEATVGCTTWLFNGLKDGGPVPHSIPIGRPIDNTRIYVVDNANELQPAGVFGEICIGGDGLAGGYLNNAALTQQKFVADPFAKGKVLMYKTGDIGRWLPEGILEYGGRKDDQVKIRGYRVELGEIENVLSSLPGVSMASVTVTEHHDGISKKLNAYLQVNKATLPLVSNYLRMLRNNTITKSELNKLPNGLPILNSNLNEVRFLYEEIFTDHCYLKHGISLNENSCVMDIGANAGFFTVFLNALSKNITVYSVEPIPEVYHHLATNRELYDIPGKAFQVAIMDREQDIDFTYYPGVTIVSGISEDIEEVREVVKSYIKNSQTEAYQQAEIDSMLEVKLESKRIKVHARTVSQIIADEGIERIDLLKVDVENSEHHVLNGISDEHWGRIGSIIIEVHDTNGRLEYIRSTLEQKGFDTYVEKEQMLSEDDILYNLFAIRPGENKALTAMDNRDIQRAAEWRDLQEIENDIRAAIAEKLPDYMMPAHIVLLDQFPLTKNGKVDKKAFPDPMAMNMPDETNLTAESPVELALARIWEELLEVENISINDNFFNAGGDSLLAVRLISVIRKEMGVEVRISDLFENPTIAALARCISGPVETEEARYIKPQKRPEQIPLSFSQERLWFIDQLQGSVQYHIPAALRLKGRLDPAALTNALKTIVLRHEVLRTVIREENGHGYQFILDSASWKMDTVEGAAFAKDAASLESFIQQLIDTPFNLAQDQMLRAHLIRISDQDHILVVTMHHIVSDGWSMAIIVREVIELYAAGIENRVAVLPELPVQYADFAIWQRNYLSGKTLDDKLNYWKHQLEGVASLQLPTDHINNGTTVVAGAFVNFSVNRELSGQLQQLSKDHGTTLFMTLLAAFNVVLHRYSSQDDICVGTSVAGRQMHELEGLIGFFINALALRNHVNSNDSFETLLAQVKATTLGAYEHQDVPFEKVVDAVLKERDNSISPLFQVVFAMQNTIETPALKFAGIELSSESYARETSKFDIVCNMSDMPEGLFGSVQYASNKYSSETIEQLVGHFKDLLVAIVANPAETITALTRMKNTDDQQLLAKFNETRVEFTFDKTMVDLFEATTASSPDAIALIYQQQRTSYRELNESANRLARFLQANDVEEGMLIPLCMDRSPDMIVAILAILKLGAAYVPIDPAYPAARIEFMLTDTRAKVAVSNNSGRASLESSRQLSIIDTDLDADAIARQSAANLLVEIEPSNLAYVIYTSGSTGTPKGVSIMHRSNVNMSLDQVFQFRITAADSVLQFASISFDASVSEIFMAFYAGASLVLMDKEQIQDTTTFAVNMRENGVTVVTLPPVYLKALQHDDISFLRVLITAGEAADVKQAAHLSRFLDYFNAYGPTECAVCASIYKVVPEDATRVRIPIGKPIANTNMYILDDDLQAVPVGMQGEIYVSGIGLAKGYLGRPDLTAEKFIPNPFGTGKKLYKTGDMGRWLKDGNMEFLGRKDDQVKIRGYRVELGEIEQTIQLHQDVEQAVVVLKEEKDEKQLVAYYKPKHKIKLWPSVAEFYVYDELLYKTMAGDEARNAKYRNAFRKVVKDKVILEIGPGFEAILARICIEEGASKVYAVELLEESYLKAKHTVELLGLQDRIIVIHNDITKVALPEKADYCISEIVGAIGGSEGAAVLINSSRRLLKDPSHMIPSRSLTKIAAITLPEDQFDYSFEELGAYYTSRIFDEAGRKFDLRLYLNGFPISNIISSEDVFEDLDYTLECALEETHDIMLYFNQEALFHGCIVWLNLYCDTDEVIDTVSGKYTWLPIFFPLFQQGEAVAKGDYISGSVVRKLSANGLNPDFFVTGVLHRSGKADVPFDYESLNSTQVFRGNEFYQKVFASDTLKIAGPVNKDEIRDLLKKRLPDYMIPSLLMELDEFPVTISGKINKKALPEADAAELLAGQYIAAESALQKSLVTIWQEVLELEKVGINDDFFELGGHSLLAIRLISLIRKELGTEVAIGVIFECPTIALLSARLETQGEATTQAKISVQERPERIPLSFSQERLMFIDRLEGSLQYHIPVVLRLEGPLNRIAWHYALKEIVKRHEVLRTVVRDAGGVGYQYIMDARGWEMEIVENDVYGQDHALLNSFIQKLLHTPFDLSRDYMLRAVLIPVAENDARMVFVLHHIAADGWSLSVIVKELVTLYTAFSQGSSADLAPLSIQYADYAIWQRAYLQGALLQSKLDYWKIKLEASLPLDLPTDFIRPALQSTRGALTGFRLQKKLSQQLQHLSQQQGTTLFMTMLAAFKVLLYRYSGQEDICVGTPIANRTSREVEQLIGFFVNTLALRTNVDHEASFVQLLQAVRTTTLEAYEQQDVPFERVVDAITRDRDLSRHPLFQVMLILQNTPDVPDVNLGDVQVRTEPFTHNFSKFDLTFTLTETAEGIRGQVEFCTDLYKLETIQRLISHFEALLNAVVADPQQKVGRLSILSPVEEQQLLVEFNNAKFVNPTDKTIHGLFAEQAFKTPDAIAVSFTNDHLTYRELDERSNQLANYLLHKGLQTKSLVPLCIERSLEMIISVMAILKAGGVYVPVDPGYPEARIRYIIDDTRAAIVLSTSHSKSKLAAFTESEIIETDADWLKIAAFPTTRPEIGHVKDALAYVLYTSGSTGTPKGVKMPAGSLLNLLFWQNRQFENHHRRVLQFASLNFDVSFQEIFSTLCFGSTLYLINEDRRRDMAELLKDINRFQITHLFAPYIALKGLAEYSEQVQAPASTLEEVIVAGEQLKLTRDIDLFLAAGNTRLINHYGPTESHVVSSFIVIGDNLSCPLPPIGKPVDNVLMYVLSAAMELCPINVPGELYIGGAQLSTGYCNRPELTFEKFLINPFSAEGGKMYKTGDLVRWLPDGNLEYIGRLDDQVKIRGHRVELGEVENVLQHHRMVQRAVVLAREDKSGHKRLIGYIVPTEDYEREAVITYLKSRLSDYMVPAFWVEVTEFPLLPSGKVNRRGLPDPNLNGILEAQYVAPRNNTERALATIWAGLLHVEVVGIHDNFFELGGHSLMAMRVIAAIRHELMVELAIRDIFLYPTIAALSGHIQAGDRAVLLPVIQQQTRPAFIPLSFSQERLLFIDQLEGTVQYHIPAVFRLTGDLNQAALNNALRTIVNRHEALRTVMAENDGTPYQRVLAAEPWTLHHVNDLIYKKNNDILVRFIQQLIREPFDLSRDYMLRVTMISLSENESMLVVVMHHLAADGWSLSVIVKELVELYQAYTENRAPVLDPVEVQYADYSIWQRNYLRGDILDKKLTYWKEKLQAVAPLQLPVDYQRPVLQSTRGAAISFGISKDISSQLQLLGQQQGTTIFMTLLAAFDVLLHRYTNQEDICVGTPVANRSSREVENLIGFFVNTLALRTFVNGEATFIDLLQQVRATTLEAYENQDIPFEKVVDVAMHDRDLSRHPLFQAMLILQNTPDIPKIRLGDVQLSTDSYTHATSKFDLTFLITESPNGLKIQVEYCSDLFKEDTINRMAGHFAALLLSIVTNPAAKIQDLSLLRPGEEDQLLLEFNNTDVPRNGTITIAGLFEQQVEKTPGRCAVIFATEELSYLELNTRANQLAHYLRGAGVKEGAIVPLCIERSLNMLVAVLAILKAGGVYVPIDPEYPADRIRYMLEDMAAPVIITSTASRSKLTDMPGAHIIEIDNDWSLISELPGTDLQLAVSADRLVYILYTSGSTGTPKGVKMPETAMVNLVLWQETQFEDHERRVLQYASLNFDISFQEMFTTLCYGSTLALIDEESRRDMAEVLRVIDENRLTHLMIPFIVLKNLAEHIRPLNRAYISIREILSAGEQLKLTEDISYLLDTYSIKLYNQYGPTESHCITNYPVTGNYITNPLPPIGKPFDNVRLYVLNRSLGLCPVGVPGELFIGGRQLAVGYLNRPELTAERFLLNPFEKNGSIMYKTGDLARWLPDGNIEYMGRGDDQVKIRGYRVELGEIESVLQQNESVRQAVVLAKTDKSGNRRLVAYVVPEGPFDREAMISFLRSKLPEYMVPSLWMLQERFGVTPNGKVDKRSLPEPDLNAVALHDYVAPRNKREQELSLIWQELLGVEKVGMYDNFFELGGHSLLAMKLVSQMKKSLQISVPIQVLFQFTSINDLSNYLEWEQDPAEEDDSTAFEVINI